MDDNGMSRYMDNDDDEGWDLKKTFCSLWVNR